MFDIEKEREAFELFLAEQHGYEIYNGDFTLNQDGKYIDISTERDWETWQAAKAHEAKKLEGCVVVNPESLLLHAQSIRMFNDGDMENRSEEIEEHVCELEAMVEAARGGK